MTENMECGMDKQRTEGDLLEGWEAWKVKVKKRLKAESSKECPWPLEAEKLKAELLTMIPV